MGEYVSSALFVHTEDSRQFIAPLQSSDIDATVTAVTFDALMRDPETVLRDVSHVVVSGASPVIRAVLELASRYDFSVGIIPLPSQKELARTYALPGDRDQAIALSLHEATCRIRLIRCGDTVVLTKAVIGRLPMLDAAQDTGRWGMVVQAVKKFVGLRLLPFRFVTAGGQKVRTAACGCVVAPYPVGNRAVRKIQRYVAAGDSLVTVVVSSPSSIVRYLHFLSQILALFARKPRQLPSTVGFIKSSTVDIESDADLSVTIDDGTSTELPVRFEALPGRVRLNVHIHQRTY